MTTDKPLPLVPKLRFPEYRDLSAWEPNLLGALGTFTRGLTYRSDDVAKEGLTVLRSSNIQDGRLVFDSDLVHIGKGCPPNLLLREGDVAICMSNGSKALVGKSAEYKGGYAGDVTVGAFCSIFRASLDFAKIVFKTSQYTDFIAREISGGNINNLKNSDLEAFKFPIPTDENEQQMIADCFGSLDNLIAAEGRKLEALRQHKKGLMQQLFPQPGEAVPRLRFPEFSKDGAWEETTIGNMGEVITGSTPSTSRRDFYGGEFMFVSPTDISDLRYVYETKTTLTEAGFAECRPIEKNSVLFVCIGSTIGKVAQCSRPCATNQQINSLVSSPAFFADFCYYLLDRESKRIAVLAGNQAVPIINKSLFASVKVTTPAFAEQQRIANCLSSLDAQLASQEQKITALKAHKRGLLQQLFPSLENH